MPRSSRRSRATPLSLSAVLATGIVISLAGCALPGIVPLEAGAPSSSSTEETDLQSVYDAVLAADPRVADPSASVSLSGVARTMTVVVLIEGEESVTTATLTAILIAVRHATARSIETVTVIAREAADEEKIVNLTPAIAGLPSDVTALGDGGVTLSRVDLDKLVPVE
ncbi:hypothetical protein [Microbacterium binotii]|uniref:hypothetical protein n=1 Tax=Microbacterium binotii TaxID=462710 RepID=UPI001F387BF7|nr:hypothetical protein [Microbacterium binotii]UIN30746.1 hypothetical protein LXM64_00640 [Microbacterium binotii]